MIIGCLGEYKIGDIFSAHGNPNEPPAIVKVIRKATIEEYFEAIKDIPEALEAAEMHKNILEISNFYEVLTD